MWIFTVFYTFLVGLASGIFAALRSTRSERARLAAAEADLEHRQMILDQLSDQTRRGKVLGTPTLDNLPTVPPETAWTLAPASAARHRAPEPPLRPAAPTPRRRDPRNPPTLAGMGLDDALAELAQRQRDRLDDRETFYGMMRWLDLGKVAT